jgi:hypothetical protein
MPRDFNKTFKKGFNAVYYAKVRCPVCKEEIYANALKCPYCKTDFKKHPHNKRIKWQNAAMKIVAVVAFTIGISICFLDVPIIIGVVVGLAVYGLGYMVVQKIQSFKNYHYKK